MFHLAAGRWAGFGIAGNFAGHLEQAGEVKDFATLKKSGVGIVCRNSQASWTRL